MNTIGRKKGQLSFFKILSGKLAALSFFSSTQPGNFPLNYLKQCVAGEPAVLCPEKNWGGGGRRKSFSSIKWIQSFFPSPCCIYVDGKTGNSTVRTNVVINVLHRSKVCLIRFAWLACKLGRQVTSSSHKTSALSCLQIELSNDDCYDTNFHQSCDTQ